MELEMVCSKCGNTVRQIGEGHWECDTCHEGVLAIGLIKEPVYIKQEPRVDDDGIWMPYEEYVPNGCASNYRLVMSKEMFVEAYNKWIKGEK